MKRLAVIGVAGALLAAPAVAQEDLAAKVETAIAERLAQQRVTLTCSATLPETHAFLLRAWEEEVDRTADLLRNTSLPGVLRIHLREDAAPEAVMLPPETPFAEVLAFCAENESWERDMRMLRHPPLFDTVGDLLKE